MISKQLPLIGRQITR